MLCLVALHFNVFVGRVCLDSIVPGLPCWGSWFYGGRDVGLAGLSISIGSCLVRTGCTVGRSWSFWSLGQVGLDRWLVGGWITLVLHMLLWVLLEFFGGLVVAVMRLGPELNGCEKAIGVSA
ncbi:hypothetical protein M0R45_030725 [Rubus argutus]|uniref:Transmembrane protein n=1 Tax=Rubus argutus TaxID=59490 RepID=A0AAW1WC00_RUBAR